MNPLLFDGAGNVEAIASSTSHQAGCRVSFHLLRVKHATSVTTDRLLAAVLKATCVQQLQDLQGGCEQDSMSVMSGCSSSGDETF